MQDIQAVCLPEILKCYFADFEKGRPQLVHAENTKQQLADVEYK